MSYIGVTTSSREKATQADLQTTASELPKYKAENGAYPDASYFTSSITKANTTNQTTYSYSYTYNSTAGTYCLQATAYSKSFYMVSGSSETISGTCP